ncbi:MAG: hypothetical protein K5848_05950 [Lachnospiraceae bacterium]|nr:hypothetical protein [Lachnospiraceae bacterium]
MISYNLDEDEIVLMQEEHASWGSKNVRLLLTNKSIIQVTKGMFGKDKFVNKYPLMDLRVFNGKPNVRVGKLGLGQSQLELYFQKHEKFYRLRGVFTEKKWADAIEKAYAELNPGSSSTTEKTSKLPFKLPKIGFSTKKELASNGDGVRVLKCRNCGADLPPTTEKEVTCEYCGSSFTVDL